MSQTELLQMFRLIDWMMTLPPGLHAQFESDLQAFEEEQKMPTIYPCEQRWLDRGRNEGRTEGRTEGICSGIELGLKLRFGQAGVALMPRIREVKDPSALELLLNAIETVPDLAAFTGLLPAQPTD